MVGPFDCGDASHSRTRRNAYLVGLDVDDLDLDAVSHFQLSKSTARADFLHEREAQDVLVGVAGIRLHDHELHVLTVGEVVPHRLPVLDGNGVREQDSCHPFPLYLREPPLVLAVPDEHDPPPEHL